MGYCTVSCLRRDIGGDYAKMEIEGIFEKFLNIQAFVRSKGEKIHVTYFRYPPELVPLFQGLNEMKLLGSLPYDPLLAGLFVDEIFGEARIRGDAKIRKIKELIERFVDLERLEGK